MSDVVARLEMICEAAEERKKRTGSNMLKVTPRFKKQSDGILSPWATGSAVATALNTLVSRIQDASVRTKLQQLCKEVGESLGPQAVDPTLGVYSAARLWLFLQGSELDVNGALTQVLLNSNARQEFGMDARRERIVNEDLGFDTLPRMAEYRQYQPINQFVGRDKCGNVISYVHFGSGCNFDGLKKAFSIEEYLDGKFESYALCSLLVARSTSDSFHHLYLSPSPRRGAVASLPGCAHSYRSPQPCLNYVILRLFGR